MSDADIKMSDVFELPVSSLMRDSLGNDLDNPDIGEGRAIAHAINSHDALVGQNKTLRDALKDCVNDYINFDEGHLSTCIFMYAQKILEQSK